MPKDRVQPLKMEYPETGGDDTDVTPTAVDRNEDFYDGRGMTVQNTTSDDDTVVIERDVDDNLVFIDPNAGTQTLSALVAGTGGLTETAHRVLRQLIHFIDEGPAEGFATGAYRETTGTIFPTAIIWWESSAKLKKIVSKEITWSGVNPTQIVWKIYATDGSTVLATVTDAFSYSGIYETSRTRTIVVS